MGVNSSTPLSGGPAPHGVKVAVKERYNAYLPDNINRHAVLTEEKVKLVHDHWNFIADEVGSETRKIASELISLLQIRRLVLVVVV